MICSLKKRRDSKLYAFSFKREISSSVSIWVFELSFRYSRVSRESLVASEWLINDPGQSALTLTSMDNSFDESSWVTRWVARREAFDKEQGNCRCVNLPSKCGSIMTKRTKARAFNTVKDKPLMWANLSNRILWTAAAFSRLLSNKVDWWPHGEHLLVEWLEFWKVAGVAQPAT